MAGSTKIPHKTKTGPSSTSSNKLIKTLSSPSFARLYLFASLAILLATTVVWSLLSTKVQQGNADQLVNSLLFQHPGTFHGALLPGQHTFLLKWPFFYLISLLGSSATAITTFTVGFCLVTVAAFTAILYRIEKRPLVFGSICLALASVLLMIPAQPYAGGLLPVNMAMLSTRNLEYLLYIGSLALLIKAPRMRSWLFLWAVLGMSLLFASDKLFLSLSIGGALIALVGYALLQSWRLTSLSVHWLIGSLGGVIGATLTLWAINASGLTHIVNQPSIGPYGLITSSHAFFSGCLYAVLGLLTMFGANPASNTSVARSFPHLALQGLTSVGGITFLINAAILAIGLFTVYEFVRVSIQHTKRTTKVANASSLVIMLIWTTVVAFGVFIVSQHDYAVDSRYLAIALFTVFVSGAAYFRTHHWQPQKIVMVGCIITIGILAGLMSVFHTYHQESSALSTVRARNTLIAQALAHHRVDVLVGDYWRVIPTKLASNNKLNVMPLASCSVPRNSLSSLTWQANLHTHSFAYLLTFDKSLTDYPTCSIQQVVSAYGKPNASSLIAGSLARPTELLLYYDHGIPKKPAKTAAQTSKGPATVLPINLDQLPSSVCPNPTVMNIVAHEDDDLLFMNPDLLHSLKEGDCERSIYLTAGDAGEGQFYWLNREQGVEAAYSSMLGFSGIWIQRIVSLNNHEYVTIANPKDNTNVSLIFMHLPDGNLKGQGFSESNFQSLAKLYGGQIKTFNSVDKQSYYSLPDLTAALTSFMHFYQPAEIHTQGNVGSAQYADHADHIAVGKTVKLAYTQYETQQYHNQVVIPLKYYVGYPIHGMPANVSGPDLQTKEAAFLAYAKFDGSVCQTLAQCTSAPTYGSYLTRQYQSKN